jgi:hypothetical protein
MGFFGRLLGTEAETERRAPLAPAPDDDAQAIERYRYMVRTAPPETLEQAYAEGFAKLTPEQREKVRAELVSNAPAAERDAVAGIPLNDANALARSATRAEIRQPGTMERALGGGIGMGGFGANLLGSFAMGFVGSMVAQSFFSAIGGFGADAPAADGDAALADAETGDAEAGDYADDAGDDGDFGGDFDV